MNEEGMYKIDVNGFNDNVVAVINTANTTIKTNITNFNTALNTLADGETWLGSSAVVNVGDLGKMYSGYISDYQTFLTALNTDCASLISIINGFITTNGGTALEFDTVASVEFSTPTIKDLSSSSGEEGKPATIESCASTFKTCADNIKTAYGNISSAFDLIGNTPNSVLITSIRDDDPAEALRKAVQSVISSFSTDETNLNTLITNLNTAAANIRGKSSGQ